EELPGECIDASDPVRIGVSIVIRLPEHHYSSVTWKDAGSSTDCRATDEPRRWLRVDEHIHHLTGVQADGCARRRALLGQRALAEKRRDRVGGWRQALS